MKPPHVPGLYFRHHRETEPENIRGGLCAAESARVTSEKDRTKDIKRENTPCLGSSDVSIFVRSGKASHVSVGVQTAAAHLSMTGTRQRVTHFNAAG